MGLVCGDNLELVGRESQGHGSGFIKKKIYELCGGGGVALERVFVLCVRACVYMRELGWRHMHLDLHCQGHQAVSCGHPVSRRRGLGCHSCFSFAQADVAYIT